MKQLEAHSVAIGENTFYIRPLPAFKAANMSGELAALVLPLMTGLASMMKQAGADGSVFDIDLEAAAPTIAEAFSAVSGDKLETILRHLLIAGKNISVELPGNKKPSILTEDLANEIFCEEVQDMFLLAFEVIRTNYKGFFKRLTAQFGAAMETMKVRVVR